MGDEPSASQTTVAEPPSRPPVHLVSRHVPDPSGTAAGRLLHAAVIGLQEAGSRVQVTCWRPEPPAELPDWCTWTPLPPEARWRTRTRAVVSPRRDAARLTAEAPGGGWLVADDAVSAPAVQGKPRSVFTVHYSPVLDTLAARTLAPAVVQDIRAHASFRHSASLRSAYSERVAAGLGQGAFAIPPALPVPPAALPIIEEPVCVLLADWRWAPNRVALARLLVAWPDVRDRLPSARLLIAGRGDAGIGSLPGVSVLGNIPDSSEFMARGAVLAFPCPSSSGPKVKVMEAMALGLPVLTTAAGIEGLRVPPGASSVPAPGQLGPALAALLVDPARRAAQAEAARSALLAAHAPRPAAEARLRAYADTAGRRA